MPFTQDALRLADVLDVTSVLRDEPPDRASDQPPKAQAEAASSQTLSLLRLVAAVPGIGIAGYALGGLILLAQARDAGLPWHSVLASQSDRSLLLNGLQMLSYVALLLLALIALGAAMVAWSRQKDPQSGLRSIGRLIGRGARRCWNAAWLRRLRSDRTPRVPEWMSARNRWAARWFFFLAFCGWLAAALLVSLVSELLDATVSDGLRYSVWAVGAVLGVIVGWPWPRPWERRPVALSGVLLLGLVSTVTLPLQMAVLVLGPAAAFAVAVAFHFELRRDREPRISDLWRPEMLVAGSLVVLASGLGYAIAQPLSIQTVLVSGQASKELKAMGYAPGRAGLLALTDSEALVAVCRSEGGYGKAASVVPLPREGSTFAVRATPYRFHGEQSASLLNVTLDGVIVDSSALPTAAPLCGEQVEGAGRREPGDQTADNENAGKRGAGKRDAGKRDAGDQPSG
jgi:hypothetical protein